MGPAVNIIIIEARLAGTLALATAPAGPNRSRVFPSFPSEGRCAHRRRAEPETRAQSHKART